MATGSAPEVGVPHPFYWELQPGRRYSWCACGRSTRRPFCDGRSHLGTGHEPLVVTAGPAVEEVLFCGCKQTSTPPYCDGAHNNLAGGYAADDRSAAELAALRPAARRADGTAHLDGACFAVAAGAGRPAAGWWVRMVIGPGLGALHQAQFYCALADQASPLLDSAGADTILFVAGGQGLIEIGERTFPLGPLAGAYVRAGETYRLHRHGAEPLSVYVSVCPLADRLALAASAAPFDARFPDRVVGVDPAARHGMGPRYFQMLVDKRLGSTTAAQFIGHIPPSRAKMHRHLYEEALIVVSGTGVLWNDESYAPVGAGDVIFLPRKHRHSLECVSADGMLVAGVIHPGDNPAINY